MDQDTLGDHMHIHSILFNKNILRDTSGHTKLWRRRNVQHMQSSPPPPKYARQQAAWRQPALEIMERGGRGGGEAPEGRNLEI